MSSLSQVSGHVAKSISRSIPTHPKHPKPETGTPTAPNTVISGDPLDGVDYVKNNLDQVISR